MKLNFIKKLTSLNGTPENVAKGFALGSFIGMMPVPGFQMMIAIAISSLVKSLKGSRINTLPAT